VGFARLVESVTRRIQAGEPVDDRSLAEEYPAWAGAIRNLLPALRGLAELGRAVEGGGITPSSDERSGEGGRLFGDFRIVREVGRGGMGIVYEAEQVALGRRVALKVLPLAATMDPRAVQRFQLEARVVGWLQHPRIVPVHDVGQVDDVPFYAMQYVEGGSLADLIAELRAPEGRGPDSTPGPAAGGMNSLVAGLLSGRSAPARGEAESGRHPAGPDAGPEPSGAAVARTVRSRAYLRTVARLGIQAAEALEYAHGQGVVHRDIKPANLLLDRRGELWVADFGMADVQGDAGLTLTGDLPGTLRYMSPEQALGKRALVDRRTDIYSLGATLYELLTLRPAVEGSDRQEILRRIAEAEPTPIRRLNPAVPVDLETIIAKSLSKEPAGRYETAGHFADDLGRFLEGRPIAARPVGPVARSWRWCRRNPLQAVLAAGLGMSLLVGLAGITWSWREAVRQKGLLSVAEREARDQAAIAQSINRFLIKKLLGQASPESNPAANRLTLLEVLDRAAADVGSSFPGQPQTEAAIRLTIGRAYHGLGEYARSEGHLRPAFEIFRRETGALGRGTLEAKSELGHVLCHLGHVKEAEPLLARAAEETRRVFGPGDPASLAAAEYFADLQGTKGRDAEAEALYRRCLADARRAPEPDQEVILTALNNLGLVLSRQGKTDEAEALFRQVVEDSRRTRGPKHPGTLSAINNLAMLLERRHRYGEAERLFRECLESNRQVLGPHHPATFVTVYNLAQVLQDLGRLDEAEALFRQGLESQRQALGPENPATLYTAVGLASLLRARGRVDEAERLLRSSLEAQRRVLGPDHPDTRRTAGRLEGLLKDRSKPRGSDPPPRAGTPDR
jgi:serine/threonine protein kinase/tetratricopeptide (TPR) repeat protein